MTKLDEVAIVLYIKRIKEGKMEFEDIGDLVSDEVKSEVLKQINDK